MQQQEDTWNQDNIKTCMKIIDQTLNHSKKDREAVDKIFQVRVQN